MADATKTNISQNSSDYTIALCVGVIMSYAFTLGAGGTAAAIVALGLCMALNLSAGVTAGLTGLFVLFSLGLHWFSNWQGALLYEHPRYFVQLLLYSWEQKSSEYLQSLWFRSFDYSLFWVVVHGAICGFFMRFMQLYSDYLNPVRVARRTQWKRRNKKKSGKPLLRNADKRPADKQDSTILGNDINTGKIVSVSDSSLNTHALVVGTTGGGKTVTVLNLVESFINRGHPVLYIDGKGDRSLGARICDYARAQGRQTRLFSMTGQSVSYNPLRVGSFTSKKDRIIEVREWTEPHYKTLAEGFLQMVFSVLEKVNEPVNFLNVAHYTKSKTLMNLIKQKVKDGEIEKETGEELMELVHDERVNEEHIQGVAADIRNLAKSEFGHLFEFDPAANLVLHESLRHNHVIYMGLNALEFPSFARTLGKLIVNDFKSGLKPDKPQKVLLVVDEFGVFAGDQVLNIINQGRSAGVCAVLTVQSTADIGREIQRNAEQFIEQVFSNCNNFIVHRVNSASNAEDLAAIVGTKTAQQLTAQVSDGQGFSGMGSFRNTREFLYHPDELKNLATGEAVYLDRNTGFHTQLNVRLSGI